MRGVVKISAATVFCIVSPSSWSDGWNRTEAVIGYVYGSSMQSGFVLLESELVSYRRLLQRGLVDVHAKFGSGANKSIERLFLEWVSMYQAGKRYGLIATNEEVLEGIKRVYRLERMGLEFNPDVAEKKLKEKLKVSPKTVQRLLEIDIVVQKYMRAVGKRIEGPTKDRLMVLYREYPKYVEPVYRVQYESSDGERRVATLKDEELTGALAILRKMPVGDVKPVWFGNGRVMLKLLERTERKLVPFEVRKRELEELYWKLELKKLRARIGEMAARDQVHSLFSRKIADHLQKVS